MKSLIVANVPVRTDAEGRYCLNDMHKAAGGERRHEPTNFFNLASTDDLLYELKNETTGIPVVKIHGRNGGTYVVKELVYAYAMWISPSFHLKVIRAYDAIVTGNHLPASPTLESLPPAVAKQVGGIIKAVVHKEVSEALSHALPALIHGELSKQRTGLRHGATTCRLCRGL